MKKYSKEILKAFDSSLTALAPSIAQNVVADRYKYLTDVSLLLEERNSGSFLDIGGARGVNGLMLKELGDFEIDIIDRLDMSKEESDSGKPHPAIPTYQDNSIKLIKCDVTTDRFPFEDNTYDLINGVDLIEHFYTSPQHFLSETFRVLKPGGAFLFGCPNITHLQNRLKILLGGSPHSSLAKWYRESPYSGHYREYTRKELLWFLDQAKLVPAKVRMGEEELYSVIFDFYKLQRNRVSGASNKLSLLKPRDLLFYIYVLFYFSLACINPNFRYFIRIVAYKEKH